MSCQSSAQIAYINHVMESASPTKYSYVEGLFKRFLKTSPFVDLWKYYLSYVRFVCTRSIVKKGLFISDTGAILF